MIVVHAHATQSMSICYLDSRHICLGNKVHIFHLYRCWCQHIWRRLTVCFCACTSFWNPIANPNPIAKPKPYPEPNPELYPGRNPNGLAGALDEAFV